MSLWRHRGTIARAVTGELSPRAEERLRHHLARCPACRTHYDATSLVAAAGSNAGAATRERARLQLALQAGTLAAGTAAAAPQASRRRIVLATAALLPVGAFAIFFVFKRHPVAQPDGPSEVSARGASPELDRAQRRQADALASLVLRFYARKQIPGRPAGPVRLVGEVPGSGELRVARDEQVQVAYAGLTAPRHLRLIVRDEQGRTTPVTPADTDASDARLEPTQAPRLIGVPFSPGALGGRLQVIATITRNPGDTAPIVVSAALAVDP
jgi:hypothetical protein